MKYIKRKILPKLYDFMEFKEAIIIYGAKQVGKTTLMKILMNKLKEDNIPSEAIFYLDLEDLDILEICNKGTDFLLNYIDLRIPSNLNYLSKSNKQKIYLFIDEIQYL